jgi:hypothetical protein
VEEKTQDQVAAEAVLHMLRDQRDELLIAAIPFVEHFSRGEPSISQRAASDWLTKYRVLIRSRGDSFSIS